MTIKICPKCHKNYKARPAKLELFVDPNFGGIYYTCYAPDCGSTTLVRHQKLKTPAQKTFTGV